MKNLKEKFVKIPSSLLLNFDINNFTIAVYVFLYMTNCGEKLNSFSLSHFCTFVNKNENSKMRSQLLSSLNDLENDNRIRVVKTSNGILYETTEHFCDDKRFAVVKYNEIHKIFNSCSQGLFVLRLFAYIKFRMIKGLYFQSFASLGRLLGQEEKYIRDKCNLLQSLGLIANIRFTLSYKKRNKTKFVRFHIFSDMSYNDWKIRADNYAVNLKENKLKLSDCENKDELDLW